MAYATVNGTRLFYEDHGSGRPLVLLHGFGTSGRVWGAQQAEFARDHRVITVDTRGCGRSDHPATGNTIPDNVADLLALVDTLELNSPVLVGSSMGAVFSLEAARRAPERIGAVVSVDGPGYWPCEGMAEVLTGLLKALRTDRATAVTEWVADWFGPAVGPALPAWTVRQILDSGVFIDALHPDAMARDPRAFIGELAVPAVFLHGRLDTAVPVEVSRTLAGLAPRGEFHDFPASGHMPHQEVPEEFNATLRKVLSRL